MPFAAALVGGIASIAGANKAAKAQTKQANADIAFQTETRDLIRADLEPFRAGGLDGWNAYLSELGLGEAPEGYQGFQKSQDYQFGLNEGINSLQASAAAGGGLYSGAAMKALNRFGQDYGSQRRDQYLNRLAGTADTGLNAAQMGGQASTNAAAGVSNALAGIGNAQAAGAVGVGNAFSGMAGNLAGLWNYQKNMAAQQPLFGGNSWG
jgi:hypothetical protein